MQRNSLAIAIAIFPYCIQIDTSPISILYYIWIPIYGAHHITINFHSLWGQTNMAHPKCNCMLAQLLFIYDYPSFVLVLYVCCAVLVSTEMDCVCVNYYHRLSAESAVTLFVVYRKKKILSTIT